MRIWEARGEANILTHLLCDFCGEKLKLSTDEDCPLALYNFIRLFTTWHGDSPRRGETVDFDICEQCVYNKIMPLTLIEKGSLK
jgi:hypothetical protein